MKKENINIFVENRISLFDVLCGENLNTEVVINFDRIFNINYSKERGIKLEGWRRNLKINWWLFHCSEVSYNELKTCKNLVTFFVSFLFVRKFKFDFSVAWDFIIFCKTLVLGLVIKKLLNKFLIIFAWEHSPSGLFWRFRIRTKWKMGKKTRQEFSSRQPQKL